ncbi:MAG: exodeoxyribonuclease VII small subunit, partial [Lachnospiraceae bacterium]|nr:exodeoxyribonuclease VII small subunit [Lachnospiraceae bacterium]
KEEKNNSLEQNMEELEKVISELEADNLRLDRAFELYKAGMDLLLKCNDSIDKIETELKVLEAEGV